MIRTKGPETSVISVNQMQRIQALENVVLQGGLLSRGSMMSRLGMQYGTDRDVYQALGYPTTLRYEDFATRYLRQDIAKAIINRPVEATWRGPVEIIETDDEKVTGLEKAWQEMSMALSLKSAFVRLDKLASLGRWGTLLLGFDDASSSNDMAKPVGTGRHELLYVKPLSENSAKINSWEEDASSERYGLPLIYDVSTYSPMSQVTVSGSAGMSRQIQVHCSRMIHVPGELLESEIEGTPVLQAVYNRLIDLEKLVGASAEMFWRGARPGYHGKVAEGYTLTESTKAELQSQIDEYENNLRRILVNEGLDLSPLAMQVADPMNHLEIQIQMISACTGIPKRILVGSERGELASSEDKSSWLETIQARREDYAETQIIRPFIARCVQYGALPKAKKSYTVDWSDIFAASDLDKAKIGQTRASALQSYMNNPAAEIVVPPEVFYEYMLGLDEDDVEHIKKVHKAAMDEGISEELNAIRATLVNPPAGGGGRQPSIGAPAAGRPAVQPRPTVQSEENE
jgi:hypothetical protein